MNSQKLLSRNKLELVPHDPSGTSAEVVTGGWRDMATFGAFAIMVMLAVKVGNGVTKIEIVARASSSGTARAVKDSGVVAVDTVGDYYVLECLASEVLQALLDAGDTPTDVEVNARITSHNGGDISTVLLYRGLPQFSKENLTASNV
jgi:hypothetical protein